AEGPDGRDELRAVPVGEQRVPQRGAGGRELLVPAAPRGAAGAGAPEEQRVGDRPEECLLVREMVVERARPHVELGGQAAHREVTQAVGVEHGQGTVDDVASAIDHAMLLGEACLTAGGLHHKLNAVHLLNAVQAPLATDLWNARRRVPSAARPLPSSRSSRPSLRSWRSRPSSPRSTSPACCLSPCRPTPLSCAARCWVPAVGPSRCCSTTSSVPRY